MKFALVSHVLPPSWSGQAVMIYRLLQGLDPDDYCLISRQNYSAVVCQDSYTSRLSGRYYQLPSEFEIRRGNRFGLVRWRRGFNVLLGAVLRGRHIAHIAKHEKCTAVVACTGDLIDIPAGFLASQMAHIPFYAYIFDDYVFQWTGDYRQFAKLVCPFIFKHSAGVIGPNEYICEEYQQRYGVLSILVRNPCDKDEFEKEPYPQWPSESGKINIIFTGSIYHANFDCFRNLIKAMDSLKEYQPELHIFTAQTRSDLEVQGIKSERIFIHSHVPYSDILEQQRKADILFLPLAFESQISEVIHTSAPGKMGEYLASGRPVLVHAPADSYVSWYFKEHECGVVVDTNEPAMLVQAIRHIIEDAHLRHKVGENARVRAVTDFSLAVARAEFVKLFQPKARG